MRPRPIRSVNIAVAVLSLFVASSAVAAGHLHGGRGLAHRSAPSPPPRAKGPSASSHGNGQTEGSPAPGYLLLGEEQVKAGSASLASGESEAFQFRARNSGVTSLVHVYVGIRSSATTLVAGVYSSTGVSPGTLLTTGTLHTVRGGGWDTIPVSSTELRAGSSYWLAVLGSGGSLRIREREQGSCSAASTSLRSLALASTWRTLTYGRTCPVSAFVTGSPTVSLEEPPAEVTPVEVTRFEEPPVEEPVPIRHRPTPPCRSSPPLTSKARRLKAHRVPGPEAPRPSPTSGRTATPADVACQAIPAATRALTRSLRGTSDTRSGCSSRHPMRAVPPRHPRRRQRSSKRRPRRRRRRP